MDEQALREHDRRRQGRSDEPPRPSCGPWWALGADRAVGRPDARCGAGSARAGARGSTFAPTKRGGGGALKMLWWQAPTLLNPHFATGTKDQDGSRIFYEPLAAYDPDGNVVPVLAAEHPERVQRRARPATAMGDLEAQEGRELARRQAVHRRRRGVQLGVSSSDPGDKRRDHRRLSRDRPRSRARRPHRQARLQASPRPSGRMPSAAYAA